MRHIAICASGPSLNRDDCDALHDAAIPIIAVNSTWRAVPYCNYIYAGDLRWWDKSYSGITADAERWTCSRQAARRYGINLFETDTSGTFNSGQRAILFATSLGAENIILLGYDCSISHGIHWHGVHAGMDNPTADSITRWKGEFKRTADALAKRVRIINCTRNTSLTCFPMDLLENVIREIRDCETDIYRRHAGAG